MIDNEIIKANDILDKFDFFNQPAGYEHWVGMPEGIKRKAIEDKENDIKFLKDFINRQQAEIERLKAEQSNCIEEVVKNRKIYEQFRNIDKANAIKEFTDRLKTEFEEMYFDYEFSQFEEIIDNLVKEMVGEE